MRYDTRDMTSARSLYERRLSQYKQTGRYEASLIEEIDQEDVLAQYRDTIVAALGH
jgi:hypothetical protein